MAVYLSDIREGTVFKCVKTLSELQGCGYGSTFITDIVESIFKCQNTPLSPEHRVNLIGYDKPFKNATKGFWDPMAKFIIEHCIIYRAFDSVIPVKCKIGQVYKYKSLDNLLANGFDTSFMLDVKESYLRIFSMNALGDIQLSRIDNKAFRNTQKYQTMHYEVLNKCFTKVNKNNILDVDKEKSRLDIISSK